MAKKKTGAQSIIISIQKNKQHTSRRPFIVVLQSNDLSTSWYHSGDTANPNATW